MTTEIVGILQRLDNRLKVLEDDAITRVNRDLEAGYEELLRSLRAKLDNLESATNIIESARLLEVKSQFEDVLQIVGDRDAYEKTYQQLYQSAGELATEQAERVFKILDPKEIKQFADLPIEAIVSASTNTYELLLSRGTVFADRASRIISTSIAQGFGYVQISKGLREQFELTRYEAERIARTEANRSFVEASKIRYGERGIKQGIWLAVNDAKICPYCLARNGNVYELSQVVMPLHPFDRCSVVPYSERLTIDEEFWAKYRDDAISTAVEVGVVPDEGVGPFEAVAPKPVKRFASPSAPVRVPAPVPVPVPASPRAKYATPPRTYAEAIGRGREYMGGDMEPAVEALRGLAGARSETERLIEKREREGLTSAERAKLRKLVDAEDAAFNRLSIEARSGMNKFRSRLLKDGLSDSEAKGKADGVRITPSAARQQRESDLRATLVEFFQLTNGKGSRSIKQLIYDQPRAWASRTGEVNVGVPSSRSPETLFHEFGHHVEYELGAELFQSWIAARATGKPQTLRRLTGNAAYGSDERAQPDDFINPYVGKIYPDATEVVSMGLEHFKTVDRMVDLWSLDPDHFFLVLGAIL